MSSRTYFCRACGLTALLMASCFAVPSFAQSISEADAINRALARSDFDALDSAERAEAEARVLGIRRFANPQVQLSRESVSGNAGDETEWQAGVVQTFDISGRRSALRDAARSEAHAIESDIARRRQERIAEVRQAYVSCAASNQAADVRHAYVVRLAEAERVVTARGDAGDTAYYDVRRLRVEARSAEANLALARGELAAECATLSSLTGLEDASPATSTLVAPTVPIVGPTIEVRPDLAAREQRILAASQSVRAARRARVPELGVGLGVKHISAGGASATGPTISVGVTVPLFDGGGPAMAAARARENALRAELALAQRRIEADIAAAAARARAASDAVVRALAARDDASRLAPIAETAYQFGEGDVVELVDAYEAARDADLAIIDLTEAAALAAIELDLARGVN